MRNHFSSRQAICTTAILWLLWGTGNVSIAQQAGQSFRVEVRSQTFVEAPADAVIAQDLNEGGQAFPGQTWTVRSNLAAGIAVSFAIGSPFVHMQDSASKSDVDLQVSVSPLEGVANWSTPQPGAQTDFEKGLEQASVQVESDGTGSAQVQLDVRFLPPMGFLAKPGNYQTTVVATITTP